ncbi:MAG: hypothetical protein R3F14_46230, partial [Polyangiaceae bacterium]
MAVGGIPIRNAWYLLLYAWDMASEAFHGASRADVERSPSLLGLLSRALLVSTRDLFRRELGREMAARTASVRGVRGRIDFARSLKRLDFESGRASCRFSEAHIDTPRNRILRSTMASLARDPRVDHTEPRRAVALRRDLGAAARSMEGVTMERLSRDSFRRLQLGRNDRAYSLPLSICALIHRLELPTEDAGDHAVTALLRDEVTFHDLFERFVRNFWRTHVGTTYRVSSDKLGWFDELSCQLVPEMRTDITLTERAAPFRLLVVDTKFYASSLSAGRWGGGGRFHSQHLYQIYAYLRTQEHRSSAHRVAEGLLLYPTTTVEIDEAM